VDGLFTVIDTNRLLEIETEEYLQLAKRQIRAANLLILNKIDLVDARKLDKVKRSIKKISPTAVMLPSVRCQIPIDLVLGFRELPELEDALQNKSMDVHVHEARESGRGTIGILSAVPKNDFTTKRKHHDLVFESWSFTSVKPFRKNDFNNLLKRISPDIIRAKGFVYWDDPTNPLVLFNLVGQWIDLDVYFKKEHLASETRLVFIGNPDWKKHSDIENQLIHCLTDISPDS
jgi:G3E family GTPase